MPTKTAAFKAVRTTVKRTERNRQRRRAVHESVKVGVQSITKNETDALKKVQDACTAIDKAVQKGTFHANTGARKKSRLMKRLNAILKK